MAIKKRSRTDALAKATSRSRIEQQIDGRWLCSTYIDGSWVSGDPMRWHEAVRMNRNNQVLLALTEMGWSSQQCAQWLNSFGAQKNSNVAKLLREEVNRNPDYILMREES